MMIPSRTGIPGGRKLPSMRCVLVPAMSVLLAVLPAGAQRGGGGGGAHGIAGGHGGFSAGPGVSGVSGSGFRGGFSGAAPYRGSMARSAAPYRGAYPPVARQGFGPASPFRGSGPGPSRLRGYGGGVPSGRPAFYNRGGANRAGAGPSFNRSLPGDYRLGDRGRNGGRDRDDGDRYRSRYGYGYGFGYPGFYSAGLFYNPFFFDPFFGFGDPFLNDGSWDSAGDPAWNQSWDSASPNAPSSPYGYDNGDNPQQSAAPEPTRPATDAASAGLAPSPATEPGPWAPAYDRPFSADSMRQETVVTIVYKDGRAPEHIRNYALTRSALLLTGQQMREIPLDEIDMPATQKVNRAAGVDFRLPKAY